MKTTKRKTKAKVASGAAIEAAPEATIEAAPEAAIEASARAETEAASVSAQAQTTAIALAGRCGLKEAAGLKSALCGALECRGTVTLDVRGLERVDTASMQLLCAFVRDRAARQSPLQWLGSSDAMHEAARLLGVRELLGLSRDDAGERGAAA